MYPYRDHYVTILMVTGPAVLNHLELQLLHPPKQILTITASGVILPVSVHESPLSIAPRHNHDGPPYPYRQLSAFLSPVKALVGVLTVDRLIACDPHHTSRDVLVLCKFDALAGQVLLVLGCANRAADPVGGDVVDPDALFVAGAAGCSHETEQPGLGRCVLPISLCMTRFESVDHVYALLVFMKGWMGVLGYRCRRSCCP